MKTTDCRPVLKEVKPVNFLFHRAQARLHDLGKFVSLAAELWREAVQHDLQVTGPLQWHYFGYDAKPDHTFVLEVALPVSKVLAEYDGRFHFKRSSAFRCASLVHEGDWQNLATSYDRLTEFIHRQRLGLTTMRREVYIHADPGDPAANVTELQVGIK